MHHVGDTVTIRLSAHAAPDGPRETDATVYFNEFTPGGVASVTRIGPSPAGAYEARLELTEAGVWCWHWQVRQGAPDEEPGAVIAAEAGVLCCDVDPAAYDEVLAGFSVAGAFLVAQA